MYSTVYTSQCIDAGLAAANTRCVCIHAQTWQYTVYSCSIKLIYKTHLAIYTVYSCSSEHYTPHVVAIKLIY